MVPLPPWLLPSFLPPFLPPLLPPWPGSGIQRPPFRGPDAGGTVGE